MKLVNFCSCCGSRDIEKSYDQLYDKDHLIKGEFSMYICKSCSMEFINPIRTEKELSKYYPKKEYYSFNKKIFLARAYHKVSSLYHSKKNPVLNLLLAPFNSLFYSYHLDTKGKVLEIGCGRGSALEIYKKYGLKTYGIEPYGNKLSISEKNLGISRKSIKESNFPKNSFDYIILKEVLEHIPKQEEVLKKCSEWLKPSGKMVITLPNTQSLWRKIFRENWYGYDVPRHVYSYNPKNISLLLERFNLKVTEIRTYDLPYMLDGSLKFYWRDKKKTKMPSWLFSSFSKAAFAPISLIVTYLRKGSLMEVECSRK